MLPEVLLLNGSDMMLNNAVGRGEERRIGEPKGGLYVRERLKSHDVNGATREGSLLLMVEEVLPRLFHWCSVRT